MFKPMFVMLVGLPGSGKTEFGKSLNSDFVIYSSDAIRKEMFGNEEIQEKNNEVFAELHKRVKNRLIDGKSVVYDATNISSKRRRAFLSEISNIDCSKVCIVIATTIEKCKESNNGRDRKVPEYVIDRMYYNFEFPGCFEGWDNILLHYRKDDNYKNYSLENLIGLTIDFDQKNYHHSLTLGNHLIKVSMQLLDDVALHYAGILHDVGKLKTQTFVNKKGEASSVAHYYNHHNIGAYDSMFYLKDFGSNIKVDICTLIQWHMEPYFWVKESTKDKYKRIWGEELFNRIMRLHEADMNGK